MIVPFNAHYAIGLFFPWKLSSIRDFQASHFRLPGHTHHFLPRSLVNEARSKAESCNFTSFHLVRHSSTWAMEIYGLVQGTSTVEDPTELWRKTLYIYMFCRPPSWGFTVIFPLNQFFGIKVVLNNERFEWKPHQGMEKNKKKIATSGDFTVSWVCYPVSHRKCWLWTGPRM